MRKLLVLPVLAALSACAQTGPMTAKSDAPAVDSGKLGTVLAGQEAAAKARYEFRNPQGTLEFFGIAPGMTVVEALPGRGWYTKILLPYLGEEGSLIGANYATDMWSLFSFASPELIERQRQWGATWPLEAEPWRGGAGASISTFVLGSLPDKMAGQADAVLLIRALHNLSRFESEGGYLTAALADVHRVLKPGGIVGVVQHEAPAEADDAWADGSKGYLKRDVLIAVMRNAGFEFVAASDINANPKDRPGESDIVWRLPPSYATSREDPSQKAQYEAIGESNRMTLKFRKPG